MLPNRDLTLVDTNPRTEDDERYQGRPDRQAHQF